MLQLSLSSLTIFCGGSEVYQQGAMMGLSQPIWCGELTKKILPDLVKTPRPDIIYVRIHHPAGYALCTEFGIGHYYGVGAYCRAARRCRRADVRFGVNVSPSPHVRSRNCWIIICVSRCIIPMEGAGST